MEMSAPTLRKKAEDLEEVPENKPTLDNLARRVPIIQDCLLLLLRHGPFYDRGTETKENGGSKLVPYRHIFRDMRRQQSQTEVTLFWNVPASPSTFSTFSASATLKTARPTLPLPTQPTQYKEDEVEDLYDDALPPNEQ